MNKKPKTKNEDYAKVAVGNRRLEVPLYQSMARLAISTLVVVVLVAILHGSSHGVLGLVLSSRVGRRQALGIQRGGGSIQIPNCSDMVSESQCSRKINCQWCRSEAIDDMCFSKLEAWRLPQQVFSCKWTLDCHCMHINFQLRLLLFFLIVLVS